MQPVLIIHHLKLAIESGAAEGFVDRFEGGEDTCKEFFEGEGWEVGGEKGV